MTTATEATPDGWVHLDRYSLNLRHVAYVAWSPNEIDPCAYVFLDRWLDELEREHDETNYLRLNTSEANGLRLALGLPLWCRHAG